MRCDVVSFDDIAIHPDCLPGPVVIAQVNYIRACCANIEEFFDEHIETSDNKSLHPDHIKARDPTYTLSLQPSTTVHSPTSTARDRRGTSGLSGITGVSQRNVILSVGPNVTNQGPERDVIPPVLVSSALFADGRSHYNTEKAKPRQLRSKTTPISDLGLLSLTKSNQNIANLLQQAKRNYQADAFELEREIVTWYITVFNSKNIARFKQKILAIQVKAPSILPPSPELPKMLGTVAQDVYRIKEWPKNDPFRQFHLLLLYARLAQHWTKLVNLSCDKRSDESKHMLAMADQHNSTKKQTGTALVSGFLVWQLHGFNRTDCNFKEERATMRYYYNVGKVVRCVEQAWGKVMLLLLPIDTIKT